MVKTFSRALVVSLLAVTAIAAQDRKPAIDDFVGTWNIEVMSHQIALVIDKQDATTATGTMMIMGRDVPLKGELVDRTITFVGVKAEGDGDGHGHVPTGAGAKPIVVTLQEDGTLAGEMMTNNGPVKWTGEKLRTRKKQP